MDLFCVSVSLDISDYLYLEWAVFVTLLKLHNSKFVTLLVRNRGCRTIFTRIWRQVRTVLAVQFILWVIFVLCNYNFCGIKPLNIIFAIVSKHIRCLQNGKHAKHEYQAVSIQRNRLGRRPRLETWIVSKRPYYIIGTCRSRELLYHILTWFPQMNCEVFNALTVIPLTNSMLKSTKRPK